EGPEFEPAREACRPDGRAAASDPCVREHQRPHRFEGVPGWLRDRVGGDTDNVSHMVPKDLLEELQSKEAVRSLFPLDYFSNMVKAISSAPTVTLYLGSDYPVKIEFKIAGGKGEVKFLLAPRIESEG